MRQSGARALDAAQKTRADSMHDIRAIRENPDAFDRDLQRRGLAPLSAELIALDEARKGTRKIYLPDDEDFREVPVYDRYRLDPDVSIAGPAVVEERESTVVLGHEGRAEIDAARNLIWRWLD